MALQILHEGGDVEGLYIRADAVGSARTTPQNGVSHSGRISGVVIVDLRGEISERALRRFRRRREQRGGEDGGGRERTKSVRELTTSADFINELGPRDCFVANQWIALGERTVCSDRD
jgi:hypothetical protein